MCSFLKRVYPFSAVSGLAKYRIKPTLFKWGVIATLGINAVVAEDFNHGMNDYNGYNNAPGNLGLYGFVALTENGSLFGWGLDYPLTSMPMDNGYTEIVHGRCSVFLKADGTIGSWNSSYSGNLITPTGAGYKKLFTTKSSFAALKEDGSISTWGESDTGGIGGPVDSGYVEIFSNQSSFSALKYDGSIVSWGSSNSGGIGAPIGKNYKKIFSTGTAFAALNTDGSISTWGDSIRGGMIEHSGFGVGGEHENNGYKDIYSNGSAFAALKEDGSITTWGDPDYGGKGGPTGKEYTHIFTSGNAFAVLEEDGSIYSWGYKNEPALKYIDAPTDSGYVEIFSAWQAFAAIKSDGSISSWGETVHGGSGAPEDNGYKRVFASGGGFAALRADGSISFWGNLYSEYPPLPTESGYKYIYTNFEGAFAALKEDGSIYAWGGYYSSSGGEPQFGSFVSVNRTSIVDTDGIVDKLELDAFLLNAAEDADTDSDDVSPWDACPLSKEENTEEERDIASPTAIREEGVVCR